MLEPSKLFVFYCRYTFRDWSNSAACIMNFSKLNVQFIIH